MGVEPIQSVWRTDILPLNHIRMAPDYDTAVNSRMLWPTELIRREKVFLRREDYLKPLRAMSSLFVLV